MTKMYSDKRFKSEGISFDFMFFFHGAPSKHKHPLFFAFFPAEQKHTAADLDQANYATILQMDPLGRLWWGNLWELPFV